MVDASILLPPVRHRRAPERRLWTLAVTAVAVAAAFAGLEAGRQDEPPLLRASFVGARAVPDVRLEASPAPVEAAPAAPAAPVARVGPIDVPADSYAPEQIVELGTLEIPKLGVRQRLMHGVTLRNIDRGPSHWPGTAMPGKAGNVVIAGHRVTNSRPFRNIDQLGAGDEVVLTVKGERSTYRVSSSFVVTPDRTDIANPTATPTLTMFACHPPGSARQRYVVRADLVTAPAV
ncbi:MAG TPA: class E sortase [Acidimicrobiales bacterium]|nr:class E sortase [Acidimicrobiales bacterium]